MVCHDSPTEQLNVYIKGGGELNVYIKGGLCEGGETPGSSLVTAVLDLFMPFS